MVKLDKVFERATTWVVALTILPFFQKIFQLFKANFSSNFLDVPKPETSLQSFYLQDCLGTAATCGTVGTAANA